MQRRSASGLPALALALLLMVLGSVVPMAGTGGAVGQTVEHTSLVTQPAGDHAVARVAQHLSPPAGGFLAVVPVAGQVTAPVARRRDAEGSGTRAGVVHRSMRPVRGPPAPAV